MYTIEYCGPRWSSKQDLDKNLFLSWGPCWILNSILHTGMSLPHFVVKSSTGTGRGGIHQ